MIKELYPRCSGNSTAVGSSPAMREWNALGSTLKMKLMREGERNNFFHYSLEELLSWWSSRSGLISRHKSGKHQKTWGFVANTSTRWVFAFKDSELFHDQGLGEEHGLGSCISNHEYPPPWTLTSPAWPQTCLISGDVPGDPAGGCDFICMGSLVGWFRLSEVLTLVRK